jgi:hypothetical protein
MNTLIDSALIMLAAALETCATVDELSSVEEAIGVLIWERRDSICDEEEK